MNKKSKNVIKGKNQRRNEDGKGLKLENSALYKTEHRFDSKLIRILDSVPGTLSDARMAPKWFFSLFITIFIFSLPVLSARYDPDHDSENPFANDTNILSLTDETLTHSILGQSQTHLILLYSQLCPNCISYILEMQTFARQIRAWSPIVRIAALNCITFPVACMNLKVSAFPSYILVPANAKEIPKNATEQLVTFSQILPEMIDFLQNQTEVMNGNSLSPTLVNNEREICNLFQFQNRIISPFVILEPVHVTQIDGLQLLLDLFEYRDSIQVRRFYTSNSDLFGNLTVLRRYLPAFFEVDIQQGNCSFR